jgi:hypothetical protein
VWPEAAKGRYMLDQRDLCTALAMIFHEPKRHIGKVLSTLFFFSLFLLKIIQYFVCLFQVYHFAGLELLTGLNMSRILASMVGEEITFIETSNERIHDYLLMQGYSEVFQEKKKEQELIFSLQLEAQTWLQMICAPALPSRPSDLDLILDIRPTSFSKWLTNNIHSFSDIWTTVSASGFLYFCIYNYIYIYFL